MTRNQRSEKAKDERLRGRAGVEQRKRRLANEPLCRHCQEKGHITLAVEVDHITPLAFGGTDTDDNVQSLCSDCHAIKTAYESAAHGGAANHPDWLKPSAIPLTIVCGPPASGKSTYVRQQAKSSDTVIDLDAIAAKVEPTYRQWSGMLQGALLNQSIRVRNAMLGSLSRAKRGKAWFIVSAPTQAERNWWHAKLGGTVVLLDPGADECKRRAQTRGTPNAVQGVDEWHRKASHRWQAPRPVKVTVGTDGWPL